MNLKGLQKFEIEMVNIGLSMRPTLILVRVQEGKQSLSSNPIGITFVIQYLPASELLTEPDKNNRVCTIRTSDEVLVLWVEPDMDFQ